MPEERPSGGKPIAHPGAFDIPHRGSVRKWKNPDSKTNREVPRIRRPEHAEAEEALTRLTSQGYRVIALATVVLDAPIERFVDLHLQAQLPLLCQRTLERFFYPVDIQQRLGLIRDEAEEAALLPDVEAVLVDDNGSLHPADLIEDELILAIPVVPINPDSEAIEAEWPEEIAEVEETPNPFAALSALKDLKR